MVDQINDISLRIQADVTKLKLGLDEGSAAIKSMSQQVEGAVHPWKSLANAENQVIDLVKLAKKETMDAMKTMRGEGKLVGDEWDRAYSKLANAKTVADVQKLSHELKNERKEASALASALSQLNNVTSATGNRMTAAAAATDRFSSSMRNANPAAKTLSEKFSEMNANTGKLVASMGRGERMMMRMFFRMMVMGIAVKGLVGAYKDATLMSEDLAEANKNIEESSMKLREELAVGLAPVFTTMTRVGDGLLKGINALLLGWEGFIVGLTAVGMKVASVIGNIRQVLTFKMDPKTAADNIKKDFSYIDDAYNTEMDRLADKLTHQGEKLKAAISAKSGEGSKQEALGSKIMEKQLADQEKANAKAIAMQIKHEEAMLQAEISGLNSRTQAEKNAIKDIEATDSLSLEEKIAKIKDHYDKLNELAKSNAETETELQNLKLRNHLISQEQYSANVLAVQNKLNSTLKANETSFLAWEKKSDNDRKSDRMDTMNFIGQTGIGKLKEFAKAQQILKFQEVLMEAPVASAKAMAAFPPPINFILAGSVYASVIASAAEVMGAKFAKGAWEIPGTPGAGDVYPALLSPGEMVIPASIAGTVREEAMNNLVSSSNTYTPMMSMANMLVPAGLSDTIRNNSVDNTVSGNTISVSITGNTIANDMDLNDISEKIQADILRTLRQSGRRI